EYLTEESSINFSYENRNSDHVYESLKDKDLIFFTGGDQERLQSVLRDEEVFTKAGEAIKEFYEDGGALAGTSAGAAIMSDPSISGKESHEALSKDLEMCPGMGFLEHGIVDQHFLKRGRIGRLATALLKTGRRHGYGIDENTALKVRDGKMEVLGESGVVVMDIDGAEELRYENQERGLRDARVHYLTSGDIFDFIKNEITVHPDKKPPHGENTVENPAYDGECLSEEIFECDDVEELIKGITDNVYEETEGYSYKEKEESVVEEEGGVKLTFSRDEKTDGYFGRRINGKEGKYWTALNLNMDIEHLGKEVIDTREVDSRESWDRERPKGTLFLIGGALESDNSEVYKSMLGTAVSEVPKIGVVAAASRLPTEASKEVVDVISETYGVPEDAIEIIPLSAKYSE
ncbi:MAG: cyanophycinase, partial [Candidatus Aenigmatarchaeota archaeon]